MPQPAQVAAALVHGAGQPPRPGRVQAPESLAGHTLVAVRAAALNPADLMIAAGGYGPVPPYPYVPGLEGAGVVVESDTFAVGQRVAWLGPHSLAGQVSVPDVGLAVVPPQVDLAIAGAIGVAGVSAWRALAQLAVGPGDRVLVTGATGAVGGLAVQAAALMGASTVTAAGRDESALRALRELGVQHTIDLREPDLQAAVNEHGPYDVVVDTVWGRVFAAALTAAAPGGRLIALGIQDAPTTTFGPELLAKGLTVHSYNGGFADPAALAASLATVLDNAAAGRLRLPVRRFPLAEVTAAWGAQADGPRSKIVVSMEEQPSSSR